jgi:hypothetical protein
LFFNQPNLFSENFSSENQPAFLPEKQTLLSNPSKNFSRRVYRFGSANVGEFLVRQ